MAETPGTFSNRKRNLNKDKRPARDIRKKGGMECNTPEGGTRPQAGQPGILKGSLGRR